MHLKKIKAWSRRIMYSSGIGGIPLEQIFHRDFYVMNCQEKIHPSEAMDHYLQVGSKALLSPTPLFDPRWYAYQINRQDSNTEDLLREYFKSPHLASPHPIFSSSFIARRRARPFNRNPILVYLNNVRRKGKPFQTSIYFDPDFYLRMNRDIAKAGTDPLIHYLTYGWREGRAPSPYFSPIWYLSKYPDISENGIEPLSHFIATGRFEGRQPHHLIDLEYYKYGSPDVAGKNHDLFDHFILHGDREGRAPHQLFNPQYYAANGPHIGQSSPFAHYIEVGTKQNRSPCPAFDPAHYSAIYPDESDDPMMRMMLAPAHDRPHVHPLIDGSYQKLTSLNTARGANPLVDYIQFRSDFKHENLARGATGVPRPTRLLIPKNADSHPVSDQEPKISIITPCYRSNPSELTECVSSIVGQNYDNWELILVDDGTPDDLTWNALQAAAALDKRIKIKRLLRNAGISAATNAAVAIAEGEFLAFVDHDDVLASGALRAMIDEITRSSADVGYSDQAFLSSGGLVQEPSLKPSWSPVLFAGVMYVGHFLIVRTSIAIKAGLFQTKFDGCQDYEFMLRVSEQTDKIIHVPRVLYYWRRSSGSVASDSGAKGKIEPKQELAVKEHFNRIGVRAQGIADPRVPHRLRFMPDKMQPIKIDLVVEGDSDESSDQFIKNLKDIRAQISSINVVNWKSNPAHCVEQGISDWILFLNTNVNIVKENWLNILRIHTERSDAAFTSAHIYQADGRVVSAGLVMDKVSGPINAYTGFIEGQDGTWGTLFCDREVSALGAACTLVSRSVLKKIGGISPLFVTAEGAVIDASYRAKQRGLRNVSVATRMIEIAGYAERGAALGTAAWPAPIRWPRFEVSASSVA